MEMTKLDLSDMRKKEMLHRRDHLHENMGD